MRSSGRRPFVLTAASLTMAALVVACGFGAGAGASAPLVTVELRGGECVGGPCGERVTLERDGRVHAATRPPHDLGTVPPAQVAAIDAAIRLTDFAAIRGRPFTGECPTTYDGQELVFEFSAPTGTERVASCEVDIDFGLPLFVVVSTALGPFVPMATT